MLKVSKWLVVCALIVSVGGHWAILQSAAWVGMTFSFSQECSFTEALSKTFDGKHPCPLCKVVRAGKKAEAKAEVEIDLKKVDLLNDATEAFQFPKTVRGSSIAVLSQSFRAEAPASPPPRIIPG